MQARRATALLLSCALGMFLLTAAHATHPSKHAVRGVAMQAVGTVDAPHGARTTPDDVAETGSARTPGSPVALGTSDASHRTSSHTAQTPQIRGPPEQAVA